METQPQAITVVLGTRGHGMLRVATVGLLLGLVLASACRPAPTPTPTPTPTTQSAPTETAFFLTILEPTPESVVRSSRLTLRGMTSPDAVVSVNGQVVTVDASGGFTANVTLQEGPNLIEVVASDLAGHEESAVLAAIYIPQ